MSRSLFFAGFSLVFSWQAAAQSPELLVNERVLMGDSGAVELRLTVLGLPGQAYAVAWSPSAGPTSLGSIDLHLGSDYEMVGTGFLDGKGGGTLVWTPPSGEEKVCLQGATASNMGFVDFVLTNPVILPVVGAPGAVGTVELADSSVTSAKVLFNYAGSSTKGGKATNADLLDGRDSDAFTYTAGAGLVLSGTRFSLASADVSLIPSQNTLTSLDTTGNVGYDTSVTIGSDGLGLISYRDGTNQDLKVAHCANKLCVPFFRRR
jgi:hypothetical protein